MTRLITEWISSIEKEIQTYDQELKSKIGLNLIGLTSKACGFTEEEFYKKIMAHKAAVIPITAGEGIIGTFSESVAAILKVMRMDVFVTEKTDVAGILEGISKGADILIMADDEEFIALNVKTGAIADNNIATALGYTSALEQMAGTLKDKEVLVIGCGTVGKKAIEVLSEKEAVITTLDKNQNKMKALELIGFQALADEGGIREFEYILDATNEGGWLHRDMLAEHVKIAAFGVPLSLDEETYRSMESQVVHDYLQIGTAVMLGMIL